MIKTSANNILTLSTFFQKLARTYRSAAVCVAVIWANALWMLATTTVFAMVVVAQCQNVVPIAVAKGVAAIWQHVLGLHGNVLAKEVR